MTSKNNELMEIMNEVAEAARRFEKILVGVGHLTTKQYNEAIYNPLIQTFKESKVDLKKEEQKVIAEMDSAIEKETDIVTKLNLLALKKRLLD